MKVLAILLSIMVMLATIFSFYPAEGEGVCTGWQQPARLIDTVPSTQSISTGETLTITGKIQSLTSKDLIGELAVYSIPGASGRWDITSREPNGVFDLPSVTREASIVPFSITIMPLLPGKYSISPVVHLLGLGMSVSILNGCNTLPTVIVSGKPLCRNDLLPVSKIKDGSFYCLKPQTASKLFERAWATYAYAVGVKIQQTKDLVIINLRNNWANTVDAFHIFVRDDAPKTSKGSTDWNHTPPHTYYNYYEVDFSTKKPLLIGNTAYFLVKVHGINTIVVWHAYSNGKKVADGTNGSGVFFPD